MAHFIQCTVDTSPCLILRKTAIDSLSILQISSDPSEWAIIATTWSSSGILERGLESESEAIERCQDLAVDLF